MMSATSTAIFVASVRQITGTWRMIIILLLSASPAVMAIIAVYSDVDADELSIGVVEGMIAALVLPLVALIAAAPIFADEIDDRTLANLTLSPVPRWQIVLPKLLSAVTVAGGPLFVGTFAAGVIGFSDERLSAGLAIAAATAIGVLCYGCLFAFVGTLTTRAVVFGLGYAFAWEGILANVAPGLRYLSLRKFVLSIMNSFETDVVSTTALTGVPYAIIAAIAVVIGSGALCVWRLRTMDVS